MHMNKQSVQNSMAKVHKDLVIMLDKAVDCFELDHNSCGDLCDKFSKKLESHFLFEESQIFSLDISSDEVKKIIKQLFSEHNEMRTMLNNIRADMMNGKHVSLSEFLNLINRHHKLEDNYLYKWIDENLGGNVGESFFKNYK